MKKVLLCALCVTLPIIMCGQDESVSFERFGFKSKMVPTPTVINEKITVMGDSNKGMYYISIPSEDFLVDIVVEFFRNGDADTPFSYYYIGDGVIGNRQYNKVLLSMNSKLSEIIKGSGNDIDSPFDDRYHVSAVFTQIIDGVKVTDMQTCDFYFIRNMTAGEKQKLEEKKRKELEQKRKEEQERQRIDQFMTEEREADIIEKMRLKAVEKYYAKVEQEIEAYGGSRYGEKTFDMPYKAYVYIDFINVEILDIVNDDVVSALNSAYAPNSYDIGGRKFVKYGDGYVTEYKMKLDFPVQYGKKIKIRKTKADSKFYHNYRDYYIIYSSPVRVDMKIPEIVRNKVSENVVKKGTYFLEYLVVDGDIVKFVVTDKKGHEYYSFK